jgi:hypothetical protein
VRPYLVNLYLGAINGMKPEGNKKLKISSESKGNTRLAIANLILTAIVGIGVAIYINFRNETLQKELVLLQAEAEERTQRELLRFESEISRAENTPQISIKDTCLYYSSCDGSVAVINDGLGQAKNVRIVIVLMQVAEEWQNTIQNIGQFNLLTLPASQKVDLNEEKVDVLYPISNLNGNNAFVLDIPELPANGGVDILIAHAASYDQNSDLEWREIRRRVTLNLPPSDEAVFFSNALRHYLESYYSIARFSVEASCDNCEGENANKDINVSYLGSWGYTVTYPTQSEINPLDGEVLVLDLTATLLMPNDEFEYDLDQSDLFLQATMTSNGNWLINEIQP